MKRCNLILHCGSTAVDRTEVELASTPEKTKTWCPIPHQLLLREVQTVLQANSLRVVSEAHGLTRDRLRYFGLLQVANCQDDGDFGLVIGVRNSHDKSFPAALALGSSVFVCDNLAFSGQVKLSRKHTVHIERDLPALVVNAVGLLQKLRVTQEQRFVRYKATELCDKDAHDVMVRAVDAHLLPVTKLRAAVQEWRTPRHHEFVDCGKTAWRLFNGFTEVLKGSLTELTKRTIGLQGLLDGACGIVAPAPIKTADAEVAVAQAV